MIATAKRDGALTEAESALFANLLRINEAQVEDVMTPRTVCFMMPAEASAGDLLAEAEADAFSRMAMRSAARIIMRFSTTCQKRVATLAWISEIAAFGS